MLRLNNRSRSRIKKNKHSKNLEKNTQEKLKYEEDYNEIILNDLVTPEDREEFGMDNKPNTKKQGGLKLNISLGSKNRPKKKYNHNKNQQKDSLDEIESVNNKEEISDNIVETNKIQNLKNSKKKSNNSKKNQGNENLKNNKLKSKTNKANQNEDENKNHYAKKTHKQNSSEKNQKKVKKNENNTKESTNTSYPKTKDSNKKTINKKRKRPNIDKQETEDEVRNIDDKTFKSEIEIKENNEDTTTFRGNENIIIESPNEEYNKKASEIKEVHNKFENIVWSEDKFPKK